MRLPIIDINTYTWCSTVTGKLCTTFSAEGHEYISSFAYKIYKIHKIIMYCTMHNIQNNKQNKIIACSTGVCEFA